MEFGPTPNITKGTKIVMVAAQGLNAETSPGRWDAVITRIADIDIVVEIASPANCPIGIWQCSIITGLVENKRLASIKKIEEDIYILLNSWNKDDSVYLCDEVERNEYVLNDVGKIWMGSYKEPKGRRWVFGQFEDVVLPCAILLLELSELPHEDRGNPVLIARAISAVVNDADEGGLTIGRWDGNYAGGTSPHAWTGSLPIMEQYMESGGQPVPYAQCWVFSALTVSICRAIGLPCRTTTNYVSAHDTNSSLTVDKYFDSRGEEIIGGPDGTCHDSCWNFHVWNDVWMSRPDLPQGYGGWQIIDATPQEMSESLMRCGPASVEAVRKGQVGFLYDTPFVFSEVNADVCHFREDPQSYWGYSRSRMNQYHVGRRIITKRVDVDDDVGDADMWDVTQDYKNAEGSREERMAVFNAVKGVDKAQVLYDFPDEGQEDVFFDLIEIDQIHFGQPFQIIVNIENRSSEVRSIDAVLTANSIFYTGVTVHRLKRAEGHFKMKPNSTQTLKCEVLPEEYEPKLVDHSLIKIHAVATVSETRQTWSEEDDFPLIKPPLNIQIDGRLVVGHPCTATFSFTNPLERSLTNCTISFEGPGLQYPKLIKASDIDPKGFFSYTESFHPRRAGDRKFVATFSSDQIADIFGSLRVVVELLWPLILFVLLMLVRSKGLYLRIHQCHFEDKPLPSAGQFLFWQGLVCSFNNTCHPNKKDAERNYSDTRSSDLSLLLNDAQAFTEMTMNRNSEQFAQLIEEIQELADDLRNGTEQNTSSDGIEALTISEKKMSERSREALQNVSYYLHQNLEKLTKRHKYIDLRLGKIQPYLEIINVLRRINISYVDLTGIIKEVPKVKDIFVRLHHFMCGNTSNINIDTMLEQRHNADNLRGYVNSIQDAPATIEYQYDPDASKECNVIYEHLETSPHLKFIWRFLKPFVRGKIVYAPNTTVISRVMSRVVGYTASPRVSSFKEEQNFLKIDPKLYKAALENMDYIITLYKSQNDTDGILSTVLAKAFLPSIKKASDILKNYQDQIHEFNNGRLTAIVQQLSEVLKCYTSITMENFATEEEAENRSMALSEKNELLAQVTFRNEREDKLDPFVHYKIKMNSERMAYSTVFSLSNGPNYRTFEDLKLITYGFIYLQDMVERSVIHEHTNRTDLPGYVLKQLPHPCFVEDWFLSSLGGMFPMFMVLSWVYTASMIIKSIVYEKEQKLRETMRVLGMNDGIHWCSWFLDSIIPMIITVFVLSTVLVYGGVIANAEYTLVVLFLLCYAVSTITMCFLVSVFFSKANLAASSGGIIFFITYLPFPLIDAWFPQVSPTLKELGSLLSNVALGMGSKYFALRELEGTGAKWSNVATSPLAGDDFSIIKIMIIFLLDAFLYFALAWYIENVFPGIYGIPKSWYYPFTVSYWYPALTRVEPDPSNEKESFHYDTDTTEAEPYHLEKGVSIKKLSKVYKNGKVAIKDLSLNFYQDQITAFLGTNGAGKTTTISILTGLFTPTSGSAEIYGHKVGTQMNYIRRSLGICPQYNILFPDLTVQEHLWFFARLKGHSAGGVQVEVQTLLSDLGLYHKRNAFAKHLSGGMKRKLSIAIAFIGGSRTVVLDEPTAGVDPYSRMGIWNLLLKYKKGRTIILTTHNMAEADLLGDRIAIVDAGKLVCCGSNGFLKSKFGWGYILTVDCNLEYRSNEAMARLMKQLKMGIQEIIPETKVIEKFGTEIKFKLPKISGNVQLYQTLFDYLLHNKKSLGISSFGFSDTSLEEIFLKLTSEKDELDDLGREESSLSVDEKKFEKNFKSDRDGQDKPIHLWKQFKALMCKRMWRSKRNKLELLMQLILPALLVCICMSITSNLVILLQPIPLEVDLSICPVTTTDKYHTCASFFQADPNSFNWTNRYIEELKGPHSFGLSCMQRKCKNSTAVPEKRSKFNHSITDCTCSSGKFICNFNTSMGTPQFLVTSSGHGFYNVTGHDVEDWILTTFDKLDHNYEKHENRRTGGFTFGLNLLMKGRNVSTEVNLSNQSEQCASIGQYQTNNSRSSENAEVSELTTAAVGYSGFMYESDNVLSRLYKPLANKDWSAFENDLMFFDHDYKNDTAANVTRMQIIATKILQELAYEEMLASGLFEEHLGNTTVLDQFGMEEWSDEGNSTNEPLNHPDICQKTQAPEVNSDISDNIKIWFNNKWSISPVVYLNGINNLVLRASTPKNESDIYGIHLTMQRMNLTKKQMQAKWSQKATTGLLHSICIMFSLSFVPASFSIFLIEERVTGCKHLQYLSGVNWVIYWLHAYCWDLICHILSALICTVTLICFQEESYIGSRSLPTLIMLMLLYGWSNIPFMYPATFFFKVSSSAFVALASFNISVGVLTTTTTYVLKLFEDEYLRAIKNALSNVFLIFPHFCLGDGLMKLAESHFLTSTLAGFDVKIKVDLLAWNYLGKNLVFMFVEGIVFFIAVLCYERFQRSLGFCSEQLMSLEPPTNLDEDVESERKRILDLRGEDDVLVMKCLTKVYKQQKSVAVNQLCLGVDKGQCFGLIGLNGAGKTSTFKMLTGDTSITFGDAKILGHSVRDHLNSVRSRIGYCPQFDALDSKLTPTEHLKLYASLRNIPGENIPDAVESCLKCFDLWQFRDVCTRHLSGGNKRKLSTAMAILGDPQLIFLDEPTCGMDPKARRFLWSRIKDCMVRGQAVVLTSHSMSECEALCSRLSIMVNGQFMCLGSIQHLKNKFGKGYNMIIRAPLEKISIVKSLIAEKIPEGIEKSEHYTQVKYHVNIETFSLFNVLTVLEDAREDGLILDYSLSQKSLGEVFLHFVSHQSQPKQQEGFSRDDCFRVLCCPNKIKSPSIISSSDEFQ